MTIRLAVLPRVPNREIGNLWFRFSRIHDHVQQNMGLATSQSINTRVCRALDADNPFSMLLSVRSPYTCRLLHQASHARELTSENNSIFLPHILLLACLRRNIVEAGEGFRTTDRPWLDLIAPAHTDLSTRTSNKLAN